MNGEKEQKFYTFLKNACPPTSELLGSPGRLFWEPMKVHDIRWNFEKFLVGPDGVPVMRWYHRTTINTVKLDILAYMRRRAALEAKRQLWRPTPPCAHPPGAGEDSVQEGIHFYNHAAVPC